MLAGCSSSSSLLSPRHRLRSEATSPKFQACHFPMNTAQRLDLPCTASFPRKESSRSVPASAGLSVEEPKAKTSCSIKQSIRLPPLATTAAPPPPATAIGEDYWDRGNSKPAKKKKSLKRLAEDCYDDETSGNRVKRKRESDREEEDCDVIVGQFWLNPHVPLTFSTTCRSGSDGEEDEEEKRQRQRVCYVPTEPEYSPAVFPFPDNPWMIESFVTETTDSGGGDDRRGRIEGSSAAASSASSGSEAIPERDINTGNGSRNRPYHHSGGGSATEGAGNGSAAAAAAEEAEAFELVSNLTSCVEAIGARSVHGISHSIAKLGDGASPRANSPLHRVMAYFTEALALRATRIWPQIFHVSPPRDFERPPIDDDDDSSSASALRILNQVTPIPRFIHFTANEMLLRAFEGKERVHVIDLDIKQGLQWPSLLQSLAARLPHAPSHVRITGVGESKRELTETGERLAGVAAALGLPFEFHAVAEERVEDLRLWMLHVKRGESVGVNCAFQLHRTRRDSSGAAFRDLAGLIRSAGPAAVVVAEQEAEHDAPGLEARVWAALRYYCAVFEAVGSGGAGPASPARGRVEEMFGREIRNIVACEGSDRAERHVGFATWRRTMEGTSGGFRRLAGPAGGLVMQGRMLLRMYGCEEGRNGYFIREVDEEGGGVTLGWQDQPLFTVSAWAPIAPN